MHARALSYHEFLLHGREFHPPVRAPALWRIIGRTRLACSLSLHQEPFWRNGKMLHEIALYRFGPLAGQRGLRPRCLAAIGIADNLHPGRSILGVRQDCTEASRSIAY